MLKGFVENNKVCGCTLGDDRGIFILTDEEHQNIVRRELKHKLATLIFLAAEKRTRYLIGCFLFSGSAHVPSYFLPA